MKPLALFNKPVSYYLSNPSVGFQFADIKGVVNLHSNPYSSAYVYLYNRTDYSPILFKKVNDDGSYSFKGLNKGLVYYLITFDINKKYNAVIQDFVTAK